MQHNDSLSEIEKDHAIEAPSTAPLIASMCGADDELDDLFSADDVAPQTLKILRDNDYYFRTHPDLLKTSVYGYQVEISEDVREKYFTTMPIIKELAAALGKAAIPRHFRPYEFYLVFNGHFKKQYLVELMAPKGGSDISSDYYDCKVRVLKRAQEAWVRKVIVEASPLSGRNGKFWDYEVWTGAATPPEPVFTIHTQQELDAIVINTLRDHIVWDAKHSSLDVIRGIKM
jgi:hypothetical protein